MTSLYSESGQGIEQVAMTTSVDSIDLPNNLEKVISNCIRRETQILEKVCVCRASMEEQA